MLSDMVKNGSDGFKDHVGKLYNNFASTVRLPVDNLL